MRAMRAGLAALAVLLLAAGPAPEALKEKAPDTFYAKFETTKGAFVVQGAPAQSLQHPASVVQAVLLQLLAGIAQHGRQEVRDGNIRWVLTGGQMGGPGGDSRAGSTAVMTAVQNVCTAIPSSAYEGATGTTTTDTFGSTSSSGLYDCRGKADALADAAA